MPIMIGPPHLAPARRLGEIRQIRNAVVTLAVTCKQTGMSYNIRLRRQRLSVYKLRVSHVTDML